MGDMIESDLYNDMRGNCTLKQILDREMEETISDEQVERVIRVVIEMIQRGMFDVKKRRGFPFGRPRRAN